MKKTISIKNEQKFIRFESNSKRAEINNLNRPDNPHVFSRPKHYLHFAENKISFKCFRFFLIS